MATVPGQPMQMQQAAGPDESFVQLAQAEQEKERLYVDELGQQRSLTNDRTLQKFDPQAKEFADSLTDAQAKALKKYYRGGGKFTDEDRKLAQPLIDKADQTVKDLPSEAREGNTIRMYNWPGLYMDKVLKQYDSKRPGS